MQAEQQKKVAEMIAEEAKADKINGMILVNEKSGKNMMGNLVRYIMEKMIIEDRQRTGK